MEKIDNFDIDELVCPHVYKRWGELPWTWMDPRLKSFLSWLRPTIANPVYINWAERGLTQRGLRCNLCELVKDKTLKDIAYNSAHIRFQAIDFNVKNMRDTEVVKWLRAHEAEIPVNIRIEKGTKGWVHVDVCNPTNNKIQFFNA